MAAILLMTGCAADPVSLVPDAGPTVATCLATDPLPPPLVAERLFPAKPPFTGEARLLASTGGNALAYQPPSFTSAFTEDPVPLRRYGRGLWSPPETFPEPIHIVGALQGAISPRGDAMFTWPSLDAADPNSVNLHARIVAGDGTWSDQVTVGDTSVGWWQDPTLPDVAVASGDDLSMVAWPRTDPTGVGPSSSLWANQRRAPLAWAAPEAVSPEGASAPSLLIRADGTAWAVWTSSAADGRRTLLTATWNGGWDTPEVIDQAGADVRFEMGAPGPEIATTSEIVIVYARTTSTDVALRAARSANGQDWTTETLVTSLPVGSSWHRAANAGGRVLVTWGSPPDQGLHATIYAPGTGWSDLNTFADVRNDAAMVALADDGRAAIADALPVAVSPDCAPRTVVRVHRFGPASGWAAPEVVDDAVTISAVTALGYAGPDLLILWRRSTGEIYGKSMP